MKNSITSCLKAEADYKQNAVKIAELETQLKSFQESLQHNLEKKSKLRPKTGIPKSDEEITAMDREIRQLRRSISELHFWESKEKRRLSSLLKEKESAFFVDYGIYRTHEDWRLIEADIAFFSQRVENEQTVLAQYRAKQDALVQSRRETLEDLTRKTNAASAEQLKSAFSSQECLALPAQILTTVVKKCKCNLWPNLPVSIQVKLLYPYDTEISFGGYRWNVLEVQKDQALLLMHGLWCSGTYRGREEKSPITWKTCYAREYLHNSLLKKLNDKKQGEICCNQNGDYIFLLSKSEAEEYLAYKQMAVADGAWWLRDISNYDEFSLASCVDGFRQFSTQYPNYEKDHHGDRLGYRPALWVKLNPGEVENWEQNRFPINCKGLWSTKGKYDDISMTLERCVEVIRELDRKPAMNSDPMGYRDGVSVDGTGI